MLYQLEIASLYLAHGMERPQWSLTQLKKKIICRWFANSIIVSTIAHPAMPLISSIERSYTPSKETELKKCSNMEKKDGLRLFDEIIFKSQLINHTTLLRLGLFK